MIISINHFKIPIYIGVTEKERNNLQDIYISLKIHVSISNSVKKDKIEETVDYRTLAVVIQNIAKSQQWRLMENLAYSIIKGILEMDNRITEVEATVEKRNTYSYQLADYIAITLSSKEFE